MDHVGKSLSGDGAKILLAGIGGLAKGIGGIASTLLGVDIVGKFLSLLREPAERFLANNINTMLAENGEEIVSNMLGNEVNSGVSLNFKIIYNYLFLNVIEILYLCGR